jgi:hypothetical protein
MKGFAIVDRCRFDGRKSRTWLLNFGGDCIIGAAAGCRGIGFADQMRE